MATYNGASFSCGYPSGWSKTSETNTDVVFTDGSLYLSVYYLQQYGTSLDQVITAEVNKVQQFSSSNGLTVSVQQLPNDADLYPVVELHVYGSTGEVLQVWAEARPAPDGVFLTELTGSPDNMFDGIVDVGWPVVRSVHSLAGVSVVGSWTGSAIATVTTQGPESFAARLTFNANRTYIYVVHQSEVEPWSLEVTGTYTTAAADQNNSGAQLVLTLTPQNVSVQGSPNLVIERIRLADAGLPTNAGQQYYVRTADSSFDLISNGLTSVTFNKSPMEPKMRPPSVPTVWRPNEGNWYTFSSANVAVRQWGAPGDVPVDGDYDGDGAADIAVWRPTDGTWYVILSSTGQPLVRLWGQKGDIPVAGTDFDGDGKADFAVFRPSTGTWYVILSKTGQSLIQQWGQEGDVPAAGADFDGDGKADFAVFRPNQGTWYVLNSSNNQQLIVPWGLPDDVPVSGDYDGDGRTDFAIWRPATGEWWIMYSKNGTTTTIPWGANGDIPISGDFDADGKSDIVIWRPSTGEWWINLNGSGIAKVIQWGANGDVPIGSTIMSAPN